MRSKNYSERMFPDSKIAARYGAGRTKTTMIIREGIAPKLDKGVEEMCQTEPFSLMCDGGSEEGADKNFVIYWSGCLMRKSSK